MAGEKAWRLTFGVTLPTFGSIQRIEVEPRNK